MVVKKSVITAVLLALCSRNTIAGLWLIKSPRPGKCSLWAVLTAEYKGIFRPGQ